MSMIMCLTTIICMAQPILSNFFFCNVELEENINVVTKEDLGEEIVFPSSEDVNQSKRMRI